MKILLYFYLSKNLNTGLVLEYFYTMVLLLLHTLSISGPQEAFYLTSFWGQRTLFKQGTTLNKNHNDKDDIKLKCSHTNTIKLQKKQGL